MPAFRGAILKETSAKVPHGRGRKVPEGPPEISRWRQPPVTPTKAVPPWSGGGIEFSLAEFLPPLQGWS
jgi:hypothetical protein